MKDFEKPLSAALDLLVIGMGAGDGQAADGIDGDEVGRRGMDRKSLHVAVEALRNEPRCFEHGGHRVVIFGRNEDRLHRSGLSSGTASTPVA